jgi:hypothetical protein
VGLSVRNGLNNLDCPKYLSGISGLNALNDLIDPENLSVLSECPKGLSVMGNGVKCMI